MRDLIKWFIATVLASIIMAVNHKIVTPIDYVVVQMLIWTLLNQVDKN